MMTLADRLTVFVRTRPIAVDEFAGELLVGLVVLRITVENFEVCGARGVASHVIQLSYHVPSLFHTG